MQAQGEAPARRHVISSRKEALHMTEKLRAVRARYDELGQLLQQPGIAADPAQYARLMKEYKSLTPLAEACDAYTAALRAFDGAKELLEEGGLEPELKELAQQEYGETKQRLAQLEEEIKLLLLPKDENDDKNVIVEIRGGTRPATTPSISIDAMCEMRGLSCGRPLAAKMALTAAPSSAFAARPYTVSVGIATRPPARRMPAAFSIASGRGARSSVFIMHPPPRPPSAFPPCLPLPARRLLHPTHRPKWNPAYTG